MSVIKFDFGEIIATNQVDPHDPAQGFDSAKEALVTIDAGTPASRVETLPDTAASSSFTVTWTGQDETGGSGLAGYDLYVSDNGGPFTPWLNDTPQTSAVFVGQHGQIGRASCRERV